MLIGNVCFKKHIKPDLGKIPIKAFRHSDAQRYYNDLLMGKGITTFHSEKEDFRHIGSANTVLVPLRCMFDYARSLELVDFNPVKELLLQMKDAVQPQSNDEFVFPKSGKGTDVAKNFFQVHVKSKPEFAKKKVHSLRYTFASMAAAIGFPEAIVAKLLGHKQQSMTARYTHLTEDAVQQVADKITRRIAALLNIPEQCAKPEDVKMFPRGIHLYKLHLVKPEEYPRQSPARKQRVAG